MREAAVEGKDEKLHAFLRPTRVLPARNFTTRTKQLQFSYSINYLYYSLWQHHTKSAIIMVHRSSCWTHIIERIQIRIVLCWSFVKVREDVEKDGDYCMHNFISVYM